MPGNTRIFFDQGIDFALVDIADFNLREPLFKESDERLNVYSITNIDIPDD
jgi:hypothetical protein